VFYTTKSYYFETTNRRKFIAVTGALATGGVASAMKTKTHAEKYPVIHHVFFWLKNTGSVEDRNKLTEGVRTLSKIETVRELRVGVVASTEKRFIKNYSHLWEKVIVYDAIDA
jgi:protein involved in ribonucleotide reduction